MILAYLSHHSRHDLEALSEQYQARVRAVNPRYFTTDADCEPCEKVLIQGAWPIIREAYEARGIPVVSLDASADANGHAAYRIEPHGSHLWWDVVSPGGGIYNDRVLRKADAEALCQELNRVQ